jgi:hypothetical protein
MEREQIKGAIKRRIKENYSEQGTLILEAA